AMIEVGHGAGLGASEAGLGASACSDEEYMRAAAKALDKAHWGVFYQPSIGRLDSIDKGADLGMKFVRIGVNATDMVSAEAAVRHAKERGLLTAVNFMKSYVILPEEFAAAAARCAEFGADIVYLVDSAGGMFPDEVENYVSAACDRVQIAVGFHGHDNLGLANANTLAAWRAGASFVDTTLRGVGRSGGNANTEKIVAMLHRMQIDDSISLQELAVAAEIAGSLMPQRPDSLDVICGLFRLHSSDLPQVLKFAHEYDLDPVTLLKGVDPQQCALRVTREMLMSAADVVRIADPKVAYSSPV
ncbi:MAG: hypothetical protein ACREN8_12880, partial [Candidatus Dormibacteraceae bacterium]